jgi:hypothetical protein
MVEVDEIRQVVDPIPSDGSVGKVAASNAF